MKNAFDQEVTNMILCARKAGDVAATHFMENHGERNFCGFAWVCLERSQRRLLESLKRLALNPPSKLIGTEFYGSKSVSENVWRFRINGKAAYTQCMLTKEEYCKAFVYVINNWEFSDGFKAKAYMESMAD